MHLDVTAEVIVSQLDYTKNEHTIEQAQKIIDNTNGFEKFAKHIISLNDQLKHMGGYVAMSNSHNYFKIKVENHSPEILKEFLELKDHWSHKYNVKLQKVENKEVYYILGV
jgi:oligoendopeptidase F